MQNFTPTQLIVMHELITQALDSLSYDALTHSYPMTDKLNMTLEPSHLIALDTSKKQIEDVLAELQKLAPETLEAKNIPEFKGLPARVEATRAGIEKTNRTQRVPVG